MDDLPEDVVKEAERLTRLASNAVDPEEVAAYRSHRDEILDEYGYNAREREETTGIVLACYPSEWIENGTAQLENILDLDRGIERAITTPEMDEEWETINAHNQSNVTAVRSVAGPVHGANASAFADYMGNHHKQRIETASLSEIKDFLTEYFPRNSWPSEEQRAAIETSLRFVFEQTDREIPGEVAAYLSNSD